MDTIVAKATADIPQAVGIVRLSGSLAFELSKRIAKELPIPGSFLFRTILDPETGNELDNGIILCFKAPHSFTGEDVVEFQLHGSTTVLNRLVELFISMGAREASPGEFSFRAYLNGKAELSELELSNALTKSYIPGKGIEKEIEKIKYELMKTSTTIEASISFPNDVNISKCQVTKMISDLLSNIFLFLHLCAKPGLPLVVIAGPQNAGKSTLFNSIVGFNRMVTSDIPGTTRDYVICEVDILGKKIKFADGPGLDTTTFDSGQRLIKDVMNNADLILWMDPEGFNQNFSSNTILIQSKCEQRNLNKIGWLPVSIKNNIGLDNLLNEIASKLPKPQYLVTPRQLDKLLEIKQNLEAAYSAETIDIMEFEIKSTLRCISMLDGIGLEQETIKEIFSTFCIGK